MKVVIELTQLERLLTMFENVCKELEKTIQALETGREKSNEAYKVSLRPKDKQ